MSTITYFHTAFSTHNKTKRCIDINHVSKELEFPEIFSKAKWNFHIKRINTIQFRPVKRIERRTP